MYYFANDFDAKNEKSGVFMAKSYNMRLKIGRLLQKLGGLAALLLSANIQYNTTTN